MAAQVVEVGRGAPSKGGAVLHVRRPSAPAPAGDDADGGRLYPGCVVLKVRATGVNGPPEPAGALGALIVVREAWAPTVAAAGPDPVQPAAEPAEPAEPAPVVVMTDPVAMFDDFVRRVELRAAAPESALAGHSLAALSRKRAGRPVRVATMCSGTESPVLALQMKSRALAQRAPGAPELRIEHVFSCEIEPFKQAYIERNFSPPLLFRNIGELGGDTAMTAYGVRRPVPGDVDLLVAGTSCVDYSSMNVKRKGIDARGESAQTFYGMMALVKRHRPPVVLQENVCGAPWERMKAEYAAAGYAARYRRIDTKEYYLPQTRMRVYLLALDTRGGLTPEQAEAALDGWARAVSELARPASASMDAFLLPEGDPRVQRARATAAAGRGGRRLAVDWGRCETSHLRARALEGLGPGRPLTSWEARGRCGGPEFAWLDWYRAQVPRVLDLMDINYLRLVANGVDANYKTLVWNLSQNVDRSSGFVRPGLCPCLTPNMIPYLTTRGGPIVGPEVLALQGIPIDDICLTHETNEQMADLAGNAMSTTVVGACAVAALLLARGGLCPPTGAAEPGATEPGGAEIGAAGPGAAEIGATEVGATEAGVAVAPIAELEAELSLSPVPAAAPDVAGLLARAAGSSGPWTSDGRVELAAGLHRCTDCGLAAGGCGHGPLVPVGPRASPAAFGSELAAALPMRLRLPGLAADARRLWAALSEARGALAALDALGGAAWHFRGITCGDRWSAAWTSTAAGAGAARLQLTLHHDLAKWELHLPDLDAGPVAVQRAARGGRPALGRRLAAARPGRGCAGAAAAARAGRGRALVAGPARARGVAGRHTPRVLGGVGGRRRRGQRARRRRAGRRAGRIPAAAALRRRAHRHPPARGPGRAPQLPLPGHSPLRRRAAGLLCVCREPRARAAWRGLAPRRGHPRPGVAALGRRRVGRRLLGPQPLGRGAGGAAVRCESGHAAGLCRVARGVRQAAPRGPRRRAASALRAARAGVAGRRRAVA